MKMNKLFQFALLIFLTIAGCSGKEKVRSESHSLTIRLSSDSSSVELYPLSEDINKVLQDSVSMDSVWHNFFAVYMESTDPEMRDFQPAINGEYFLKEQILKFTPHEKFAAGKYFARCYTPELLQEPEDIISSRKVSDNEGHIEMKFEIK